MPVTQEGPDLTVTLLSCPRNRSWRSRPTRSTQEIRMTIAEESAARRIVGGVDTHKDLHVAAVVDEQDRVLATHCFATTRQGYRQMLAWMRSFGEVQRVGIESTGSYGAGLLLPAAGRGRGPGGHNTRQARSPPAWQE